jgi:hypothetical protein
MASGMYGFSGESLLDREEVRRRLRRMSDDQLRRWGGSARHMCSPEANLGQPPRPNFVLQLEEAIAEWQRRHPTPLQAPEPESSASGPSST